VLFLDELPEFSRHVLEVLREPMESGRITISRAARQADFPARFQLVAAMNPCPCGYLGHFSVVCRCSPDRIVQYRSRISGPLLDRIDLHVEVPALDPDDLMLEARGEPSSAVRERVTRARELQLQRQGIPNAQLASGDVEARAAPDSDARKVLRDAAASRVSSARAHHRLLKVARTLADLDAAENVGAKHVQEGLCYRARSILAASSG
jgi:magnesium chelatase family protein